MTSTSRILMSQIDKQKLITRHRELCMQIASLQNELAAIESSEQYATELKWVKELETLMQTYGKSPKDITSFFGSSAADTKQPRRGPKTGTPRKLVTYKNPHTGEKVVTGSGNNRTLKDWKKLYPTDDIKTWII